MGMPSDQSSAAPEAFHEASSGGLEARGELVTFGSEPTRPETGYGYIESGDPLPGVPAVRRIRRFVEKPDEATAAGYLAAGGFLWNSGIFLLPVGLFLAELERFAPARSEERRVGKEGVSTCRYRGSP